MLTTATNLDWIHSLCRRLTSITGWPSTFAPGHQRDHMPPEGSGDYVWTADLHTSRGSLGSLRVTLPAHRELNDEFLKACEYADLLAQLVQRVIDRPLPLTEVEEPAHLQSDDGDAWSSAVHRLLDIALRLTGFRSAALFVLDPQSECLRLRAERSCDTETVLLYGRPLNEATYDRLAIQRGAVVIRRSDERAIEWLPDGMSLGACRGITAAQGGQGTLWVFDRRDRRLSVREEQVLSSIVARLSELIDHAVLIEESTLQRQLRAELKIASETQPQRDIQIDGADGWCQVAGRSESAREVGGDLCEVIPLGEDRMLIAIGDAAGHSIPAAMVMATIRGGLHTIIAEDVAANLSPEVILERLNSALHAVVDSHQFMTLSCAVLDHRAHALLLANAGHPPALLIRNGECQALESPGLLLGVVSDAKYVPRRLDLLPDDLFVFFTDGVSEAQDGANRLFRSSTIAEIVVQSIDADPGAMVEGVWTRMQAHLHEGHRDDRTLLVVRYQGCTISADEPPVTSEKVACVSGVA